MREPVRHEFPPAPDRRRIGEADASRARAPAEPAYTTEFSAEALERVARHEQTQEQRPGERKTAQTDALSDEERAAVRKLQQRDQEVRRHEQAHKAAAGNWAAGAPSFSFTRGPDGKQYATSGEVQIDVSPVSGDPEATIRKMRQVQSAARAPAHPSGADLKVAASAAKQEAAARAELQKDNAAEPNQGQSTDDDVNVDVDVDVDVDRPSEIHIPAAYRPQNADRSGDLLNLVA